MWQRVLVAISCGCTNYGGEALYYRPWAFQTQTRYWHLWVDEPNTGLSLPFFFFVFYLAAGNVIFFAFAWNICLLRVNFVWYFCFRLIFLLSDSEDLYRWYFLTQAVIKPFCVCYRFTRSWSAWNSSLHFLCLSFNCCTFVFHCVLLQELLLFE